MPRKDLAAAGVDRLLAILQTGEFEDNGRMKIVSLHWSATRLTGRAEVDHGDDAHSSWHLDFRGVVEYLISDVSNCGLNFWQQHVAIRQHTDRRQYLHFSRPPKNVASAIGELWQAHIRVANDWIPFDRYLNNLIPLSRLLAGGSGLFATGPSFLMEAYAAVLDRHGCETSRVLLPTRRSSVPAYVLVHLGEAYVICESLTAKQVA